MSGNHEQNVLSEQNLNQRELAEVADIYPFYSVAQFRLLSLYYKTHDENLEKQASKTALYFSNHKWLDWQLHYHDNIEDINDTDAISDSEMFDEKEHIKNEEIVSGEKVSIISEALKSEQNSEEPIAFQPLYTVDYFAAQGIKLSEETAPTDKLGTQLKSFTEWLKSMKKVHAEKFQNTNDESDKAIRQIAEASNTNGNVITEAMAEVLIKQGKIDNAIEMYNKLSLKNPTKSAYFAAKIQSLKSV